MARIAAAMDAAMSDPNSTIPVPLKPPAAWFREVPDWHVPPPEGPLVQIDMETGRVAALVAPYGECILDGRSGCWTPGMSKTNYEYAHVGAIVTAEGETVRTANVGGGINHFDVSLATAASLAADHYANTATRRMYGRYMDVPDVGIMFVGSMYPGSTYLHAFEAMTSALSGDWRWIESLRDHEMVGSQLVNNPGFRPNPLNRRPVLASVSFRSAGAKVAAATDCDGATTIISEWEPVVVAEVDDWRSRAEALEAHTASLMLGVVEDVPMLPPDPVDIMDLDDDGDEGEDWTEEFADLVNDECPGCRGVGCQRCGWIGYTGPDDEAVVATLKANEAVVAKLGRRRERARDGDGDGFVYDSTPRQRPVIPGFDIIGENVSLDIIKRAASGDARARKQVRDRAAENAAKARKAGDRPTTAKLTEATLGPRPRDRSGRNAWDELARDIESMDVDRQPGGRSPVKGRPRTPWGVTRAEARRSRGGRDADGTAPDRAPVLRAPNGRPIDNTLPRDTEYAYRGDGDVPFAVSRRAVDLLKISRDSEADGQNLAVLIEAPEGAKPKARFVSTGDLPGDARRIDVDGVTVAVPAADAERVRGKRLEVPSWGSGVVLSNPDKPSAENPDDWSGDAELPSKMKLSADPERFKDWSDDQLTERLTTLDAGIANGGEGLRRAGSSPRNDFARRAAEREFIAREMQARGLDVPPKPEAVDDSQPGSFGRPQQPDLAAKVLADGGFTYDPNTGTFPTEGIAVAVPGHSVIATREAFEADPRKFINDYMRQMRDDGVEDLMIGGWHDTANDEVVLDRVEVVADLDEAKRLGADRDEQAVYNLATGEEIPTGGTGGRDGIDILGQEAPGDGASGQADQGPDRRGDRPDLSGSGGEDGRSPAAEAVANPFAEELEGGETGGVLSNIVERIRRSEAVEGARRFLSDDPGSLPDRSGRNSLSPGSPTPAEVQRARGVPEDVIADNMADTRPTIGAEQRAAGEAWRDKRGLLRPPFGPAYTSADDEFGGGRGSGRDESIPEWDPREGSWVRSSTVGIPRPAEVAAQRAELERRAAELPPAVEGSLDARFQALDDLLVDVRNNFPLLSTKALHNQRGDSGDEWSPDRRAVHSEMVEEVIEQVLAAKMPSTRKAVFTGGLPGSGKTYALGKGGAAEDLDVVVWELGQDFPAAPEGYTWDPESGAFVNAQGRQLDLYVSVNSDWVKERMAALGMNTGIAGLKPMEEASLMHSESDYVGRGIEEALVDLGINIAFDGTLGSEESTRSKLEMLDNNGYGRPKLAFAETALDESQQSVEARWRKAATSELGGRFIPSDVAGNNESRLGYSSLNRDVATVLVSEGLFGDAIIFDNRGVSNATAKTRYDLNLDAPIPVAKADQLGIAYSATPNANGMYDVLDPELAGAQVRTDLSRVDGVAKDGKWVEYDGRPVPNLGPDGYPPRSVERVMLMPGVKGGTGTQEDPFDVDDVRTAAILLLEGEHQILLDQPREVSSLMDELQAMVLEAKGLGRAAPNFDLCLSGDTEVVTYDGNRPIAELAAVGSARLLTTSSIGHTGYWVDAEVRSFGYHRLNRVTLRSGRSTKVIHATDNHRWYVRDGKRHKGNSRTLEVTTTELQGGMSIPTAFHRRVVAKGQSETTGVTPSPFGILHGFVFGDGCAPAGRGHGEVPGFVVLYGEKDAQLLKHFPPTVRTAVHVEPGQHDYNVHGIKVEDVPRYYKRSPLGMDESKAYLYGWLAGYFAADGTVSQKGAPSISSANREHLEVVRTVASRLGFPTFGITETVRVGKGDGPSSLYSINFQSGSLPDEFFLIDEHRLRASVSTGAQSGKFWTVVSVEETDRVEEVFCAIVPETNRFVLADNVLTGNCKISVPGTNLFCAENKGYPRVEMPQLGTNAPTPGSVADRLLAQQQVAAFRAGKEIPEEVNLTGYFMDHLRSRGVEVRDVSTPANLLKATQKELSGVKVSGMVQGKTKAMNAAPKIEKLNKRLDAGAITPEEYVAAAIEAGASKVTDGDGVLNKSIPEAVELIRPQAVYKPRRIITTSDGYIVDGHHGWASDVAIQYGSGDEVMVDSVEIDMPIVQLLAIAREWSEAVGSPPQGVFYGPDGLTEDQRRFRRRRARSGWGGLDFLQSDVASQPVTDGDIVNVIPATPAGADGAPVPVP